jgi:hydrogenase nickel incorporation protein HypB
VVLVSVPEGPDKPAKYPKAFISSQLFLITKTDLLPHFDFEVEMATREALTLNPALKVMAFSATTGDGFEVWLNYLRALIAEARDKRRA